MNTTKLNALCAIARAQAQTAKKLQQIAEAPNMMSGDRLKEFNSLAEDMKLINAVFDNVALYAQSN